MSSRIPRIRVRMCSADIVEGEGLDDEGEAKEEGSPERSQRWMRRWRVRLGMKSLEGRTCMVAGQVSWPESSQFWMLERSYVTPVLRLTGDLMTSIDIGHRKRLGTVTNSFSLTIFLFSATMRENWRKKGMEWRGWGLTEKPGF